MKGVGVLTLTFSRSGTGLRHEIRTLFTLRKIYKAVQPDLVHHVTIKPVIYGSIVARWMHSIPTVNAVSGLGYTFTDGDRARGLRNLTTLLYRQAFNHRRSKIIFQNPDDIDTFQELGLIR